MSKIVMDCRRSPLNIGDWMSATIYSDSKKDCKCGGKFSARKTILKIDMPVCDKCQEPPTLLRIKAQLEDEAGKSFYKDVRNNKSGERLTDAAECMVVLKQVQLELEKGTFKYHDYESKKSREAYLFKNFAQEYLDFHKLRLDRGELVHYGYKHKVKYVKVLNTFFADMDITEIKGGAIARFKNSFTEKFTNRDKGLSELRTILKHAHLMEKITHVPAFEKIPASNTRPSVLKIEEAREIIPYIENEMYRLMIGLIAEYALRPCEVRAIQFRDFDWNEGRVYIRRHFSGSTLVEGRKSVKTGKNSTMKFAITAGLRRWVMTQSMPVDSEMFIFRSPNNNPVFENTLPKAWARTLKALGKPSVSMYEIRHAKATEILELSNGNMVHARDFLGHNNMSTTERSYTRPNSDNDLYVNKEADILPMAR